MTCTRCNHNTAYKFGTYGKRRIQRYRCGSCRTTFADSHPTIGTHYTDPEVAAKALALMFEGVSIRGIARITGLHKDTILSLMLTAASNAQRITDRYIRNVKPTRVQADEIWSFIGCHQNRMRFDAPAEWGDAYTWFALDSDTKLVLSFHVGPRNTVSAFALMRDLASRTTGRFQLTTDALRSYVNAVEEYFGADIDFAQLHKIFSKSGNVGAEWYANGHVVATVPSVRSGQPDFRHISTSHIERANLALRMSLRRFARLTNAYSRNRVNHVAAVTLYFTWYNFCRVHQTLRVTPAMEAGITEHIWTISELISAAR